MINKKKLIISLLLPLAVGFLSSISVEFSAGYEGLVKPSIAPPGWVFPIVWTVLYLMMGLALYLVWNKNGDKTGVYFWFFVQLILNALWSPVFFGLGQPAAALVIAFLLIIAVIFNIRAFSSVSKTAGWLLVPYLLWLIYACILNYLFLVLNS